MDSNIFIGVADPDRINDPEIENKISFKDNKIGGLPIFSPNIYVNETLGFIRCSSCLSNVAFILQIYCPVDYSSNDRLLYLFSCVKQSCNKKEWFVYRVLVGQTPENRIEPANDNLFDDNWDDEDGDSGGNDEQANYIENDLTHSLKHGLIIDKDNAIKTDQYKQFKTCFISVFEEPIVSKLGPVNNDNELDKTDLFDKGINETYEKTYATGFQNDKENYKFYKRLRRCPEQIIRYDWSGKPLLSTVKAIVEPKPCQSCGSKRVFELQLMPSLIRTLSDMKLNPDAKDIDIDDFETILVYTCSKNCQNEHQNLYREESFIFKDYTCNI